MVTRVWSRCWRRSESVLWVCDSVDLYGNAVLGWLTWEGFSNRYPVFKGKEPPRPQ